MQDFNPNVTLTYRAVKTEEVEVNINSQYRVDCFKTKMNNFLRRTNEHCQVIKKDDKLYLEIYNYDGFVPIDEDLAYALTNIVKNLIDYYPDHMVVFDAKYNTSLPSSWMLTVIPHINIPNKLIGGCSDFDMNVIYHDGVIMAIFPAIDLYHKELAVLQKWIRNTLDYLYNTGCVMLDYDVDRNIIEKWELEPIAEGSVLYKPSWVNTLIAPNPTQFMLNIDSNGETVISIFDEVFTCGSYIEADQKLSEIFS